jgi:hypothetical protein
MYFRYMYALIVAENFLGLTFGFSVGLDKVDKVCSCSDIDFVGAGNEA